MVKPVQSIWDRFPRRWLYGLLALLSAASVVLGTATVARASFPWELLLRGVQVIQLSSLSDRQEVELGGQINQQLVNSQVRLYRDRQINGYVQRIGQRLVPSSSRPDIPYTFQVVDDRSINAFATMGGYVYVHTGLIAAADNEAELASVIAHEIGHIAGRHAVEQMRQRAIASGVLSAAGLDEEQAVQIGVEVAVNLPNSREDEYEADTLGLENLTQAGYSPQAMVSFMQKLAQLEQQAGGRTPTFLRTHPASGDRVLALQAAIPEGATGRGLNQQAYQQRTAALR